ncbi:DUF1566 domain-containing protein [Patescibacteria group bacterium]
MLSFLSLKKSISFKIYLLIIVLVSAFFISIQLIAQVEETPYILKEYLGGQACPNFIDINELTMKDECTGLVWARRELPTFYGTPAELEAASPPLEPGYSWDLAKQSCEEFVEIGGINMFRLPTVEEMLSLIEYKCDATSCSATLVRDLDGDGTDDIGEPYFSRGNYWTINDFNEPAAWTLENSQRDYKRSVNLLTGEVDNPVYNKNMRLNAWCVVDRNSEITEMQFTTANITNVTNGGGAVVGQSVDSGNVTIVFHRECGDSANPDDDCAPVSGLCDTDIGYCYTEIPNLDATLLNPLTGLPYPIVICAPGYHAEGADCVPDCDPILGCWTGNDVNGYYSCPDEDLDGVFDCDDNCPGIFNPAEKGSGLQGDADGDGIGDLCDNCFDYPAGSGNCIGLVAKQPPDNDDGTSPAGQWVQSFVPYGVAKSPREFYCYDGNCTAPLTTYPSSSNIVEYDMIYPDRSNIFAYLSTDPDDNPATIDDVPVWSLGFIHDIPSPLNNHADWPGEGDNDGGDAIFTFSCPSTHANCVNIGDGYSSAVVVAADDNLSEFSLPTTDWYWATCCTDGGMLELLTVDTGWCLIIDPSFPSGINELFLKEPGEGGYSVGYTVPVLTDPIEICYEPTF